MKDIINNEIQIYSCIVHINNSKIRNISTRNASISGNKKCLKFLDWLYSDCTIYLERKYHKYMKCKEEYRNYDNKRIFIGELNA